MKINFLMCLMTGISGILCHLLFDLDHLNTKARGKLNIAGYFRLERFSLLLTFTMLITAAYFHELFFKAVNHYYDFDGYALGAYWLLGLFGQTIMVKIIGKGKQYLKEKD